MNSTVPKRRIGAKTATWASVVKHQSTDAEDRQDHVATAAYYKAEARGFIPGFEIDDWLEAEAELNTSAVFLAMPANQADPTAAGLATVSVRRAEEAGHDPTSSTEDPRGKQAANIRRSSFSK